ncbi:MAG: photosynthetic complex putative assembly protein PuhB [Pseudomonadota bacterium]
MARDEIDIEPIRGLPAKPPAGERILWQGAPDGWALARGALSVRLVALLFAAVAIWRGVVMGLLVDGHGLAELARTFGIYAVLCGISCSILIAIAFVMARTTVYTITTHRVGMRIGAALTVTLNLPFRWIEAADLKRAPDGTGDIYMALKGETRLSYLVCWPHVRPWRMARTVPALRAIPDVNAVAEILRDAAEARLTEIAARETVVRAGDVAPDARPDARPEPRPEATDVRPGGALPMPAE